MCTSATLRLYSTYCNRNIIALQWQWFNILNSTFCRCTYSSWKFLTYREKFQHIVLSLIDTFTGTKFSLIILIFSYCSTVLLYYCSSYIRTMWVHLELSNEGLCKLVYHFINNFFFTCFSIIYIYILWQCQWFLNVGKTMLVLPCGGPCMASVYVFWFTN